MADITKIEWCDSTFNPWIGCTKVSPACDDCYAARSTPARTLGVAWGPGETRHRTGASNWKDPKRWQADAPTWQAALGRRQRVFCASLADWLDNEVPIKWLADLLQLVYCTPDLDWLLLTKRIGNWASRISEVIGFLDEQPLAADPLPLRAWLSHWLDGDEAPRNVWLGITVVNQPELDRDRPKLQAVPARVRFLSMEPLLGPVDLGLDTSFSPVMESKTIHWVICGGESGPKARPMHPDWARDLRDQCAAAGVPFLFKQWGEWTPGENVKRQRGTVETAFLWDDGWHTYPLNLAKDHGHVDDQPDLYFVGKKAAGRQLDGRTHDEFPHA